MARNDPDPLQETWDVLLDCGVKTVEFRVYDECKVVLLTLCAGEQVLLGEVAFWGLINAFSRRKPLHKVTD